MSVNIVRSVGTNGVTEMVDLPSGAQGNYLEIYRIPNT
jgi:hypothetical protein